MISAEVVDETIVANRMFEAGVSDGKAKAESLLNLICLRSSFNSTAMIVIL